MILTGDFLVGVLLLDEALDEEADDEVEPETKQTRQVYNRFQDLSYKFLFFSQKVWKINKKRIIIREFKNHAKTLQIYIS